jgi:hypothetical protein
MTLRVTLSRHSLTCAALVLLLVACASVFACASAAYAYPEWSSGTPEPWTFATCATCHALDTASPDDWDGSGPHASYLTTTNKCKLCHAVHNAPASSVKLLRGATVSGMCQMCHDGTGGFGPYDSIPDADVRGEHSIDVVGTTIPGGSGPFDGLLSCGDCHSVHGANTVNPFIRDSTRAYVAGDSGVLIESDCLLRNDVNTATLGAFPDYGARWCASCHDQRHSASSVLNHPVNTAYDFGYGDVITTAPSPPSLRNPNYSTSPDLAIGMGQTNAGYVMISTGDAEPATGDGRVVTRAAPLCQQCHEDARDVEAIFDSDAYSPGGVGLNPPFLTFPHQTTSTYLRVETSDDLCLNCHSLGSLP